MPRRRPDRLSGPGPRETLRRCYAEARALLFPGIEDFGIVPLEAQSAGTPVIALGAGGALETVENGRTGLFFARPEAKSLCEAIREFERCSWDPEACRAQAARFAPERFRAEFRAAAATVTPIS